MNLLYIIPAALVIFVAVLLIRAFCFNPPAETFVQPDEVTFDKDAAVDALAKLIRCRTVSYADHSLEDDAEFDKLIALLPELYPHVAGTCTLTRMEDRALLFKWKGRGNGDPAVLMAHYDVVPVDEDKWEKDPFGAEIENGVMWGRGTLDTKGTFNGILSAAENLIQQGFVPENDIYFAFSGGEEVNGKGAVHIVDWFIEQGISPAMVLDEGGAVVENVFPGVRKPCAMVGIAEKGMLNMQYSVASGGGHASAPAPHTPVGKLAKACVRMESHPFRFHLTEPVRQMFDTLGRHSTFLFKIIFANLWCFRGVLDLICRAGGGELNALVRTTVAFTQMTGSKAPNVIPPTASMVSNLRLNPADTVEGAAAYIRRTVDDPDIILTIGDHNEPSPISRTDCEGWQRVVKAVSDTWQGSIVAPYLMMQCSDSRHYGRMSDKVYRFSAMDLTKEERGTIHGNNERIRLEVIHRSVEFFIRVMKQC